jgi:uncharacterized protein (DUF1501 family)
MDRRRFLQIAGIAGLSVMAPVGLRDGSAASVRYKGPFWIMVNAGGGWDPTITCDPKGGVKDDPQAVNQSYTKDQIGQAGAISYAPTILTADAGGTPITVESCANFFSKHHGRLTVINGIDTTTNNHDSGSRTTWSGQTAEGMPSFAALAAGLAVQSIPVPLAFLSSGGYDATGGVVPLTRVGNLGAIAKLAYPNTLDANDPKRGFYHTQATASRIAAAQAARIQSLRDKQTLSSLHGSMNSLFLSRQGDDGLAALGEQLRGIKLVTINDIPDLAPITDRAKTDDLQGLMQQAQVACLAFKAGVAVSASISMGGYDTHNDNDVRQTEQTMQLFRALDFLYGLLEQMGIADQTYVIVGSDFGRTPYYNDQNGKDHWNITSMILSGPNIPGDRVIGSTDDGFKPLEVDKLSLQPSKGGIRLETKHVHRALRKVAGITNTPIDTQFPLLGEDLPLFG